MASSTKRMGVLLIQLGTPNDAGTPAVRRFLREFLSDPRVLDIPGLLRFFLVNFIIAPFRAPKSSKIYKELWEVSGGHSPLLTYTDELTSKLNDRLSDAGITVHMAMRYQGPSILDTGVINLRKFTSYEIEFSAQGSDADPQNQLSLL